MQNLQHEMAIKQLNATFSYIIDKLEEHYSNDTEGKTLKEELKIRRDILTQDPKAELLTLSQKLEEHEILTQNPNVSPRILKQALAKIDKAHFQTLKTKPFISNSSEKNSLIYLLTIAFAKVFPANKKNQDNTLLVPQESEGTVKYLPVPEEKEHLLMPAHDGLLHFADFIIKSPDFAWQDKIRAAYHLLKEKKTFEESIELKKTLSVQGEFNLELLGENTKKKTSHPTLSLSRVEFFREMVYHVAEQKTLLSWEDTFLQSKQNTIISEWIVTLCCYIITLRDKKYCTDTTQKDTLSTLEKTLFEKIQSNNLSQQYLELPEESEVLSSSQLEKEIEKILSHLASSSFCELVQKQKLSLEDALTRSREKYREPRDQEKEPFKLNTALQHAKYQEFVQSEDLVNKIDLEDFLNHAQLDRNNLCERSEKAGTLEDINNYLFEPEILKHINNHIKVLNWEPFIDVPGALKNYVDGLDIVAERRKKPSSSTLAKFIEEYNKSEAAEKNGAIEKPSPEYIKRLNRSLEIDSDDFKKALQNPLAQEVLYTQHHCTSLLEALAEYGNLPQLLRDKKIKPILDLAKDYLFNAKNDVVLKCIQGSVFPIWDGLALSGQIRTDLRAYYGNLYSLLTSEYILSEGEKNCETYVLQHLKYIFSECVTPDTGNPVGVALTNEYNKLNNNVLYGLVQEKVLSLEEALNLGSELSRFYRADEKYKALESTSKAWIKDNGCANLPDIISKIPSLTEKRKRLDELKNGTEEEKEKYLQERIKYFSSVIGAIERININLNGPFTQSIHAATTAGIPFIDMILTSEKDREKIQKECENAAKTFEEQKERSKSQNSDNKSLLEAANIETLPDLLLRIKQDNPSIQPIQLYPYASQAMNYVFSRKIKGYFERKLLSIGAIAKLSKEAFELLSIEYRPLNIEKIDKKNVGYLKYIFTIHFQEETITEVHATQAIQKFREILRYLKNPLISAICAAKHIGNQDFMEAVRSYNEAHPKEDLIESLRVLEERFLEITREEKGVQSILASSQKTYSDFLRSAFESDTKNSGQLFSFDHFFTSCACYLDNLDSSLSKTFRKHAIDPIVVFISTPDSQESFLQAYKKLSSSLKKEILKNKKHYHRLDDSESERSDNDDTNNAELLASEYVWACIKTRTIDSLESATHTLEIANQNLENEEVRLLINKGMSLITSIRLSQTLRETISLFLSETAQNLLDKNKDSFYVNFGQFINDTLEPEASLKSKKSSTKSLVNLKQPVIANEEFLRLESSLTRKLLKVQQLPTIMELIRLQPENTREILNLSVRIDSTDIEENLKNIQYNQTIQRWAERYRYTSPSQMVADCFTKSALPISQLGPFLENLIKAVENYHREISSLVRAGLNHPAVLSVPNQVNSLNKIRHRAKKHQQDIEKELLRALARRRDKEIKEANEQEKADSYRDTPNQPENDDQTHTQSPEIRRQPHNKPGFFEDSKSDRTQRITPTIQENDRHEQPEDQSGHRRHRRRLQDPQESHKRGLFSRIRRRLGQ